ncbi:CPBP family intramembrane metalloprotease [bacterium]|nr:CPBP family intramembrane metalloprotease [bacterium]
MELHDKHKWTVKDVFNVFVMAFFLEFVFYLGLRLSGAREYLLSLQNNALLSSLFLFGLYVLQSFGLLFPLWYIVIRKYGFNIKQFGFKWIGIWKTIAWITSSYIFYIGLSIFVITLFSVFGIGSFGFEPQKSLFDFFGNSAVGIIFAGFVAIILAPFIEEIFFRGFVLNTLVKRISPIWGIILTALIFAAVHFEFQSIMPLIILAFVLNILYVRTQSIWPGILFHIINNIIAFFVLLLL